MASKRAGALLGGFFRWFKAPWRITGPVSSPEYLEALMDASEYRQFAPSNPPTRAWIPHARPDRIYNIKYYDRDLRRAEVPRTVKSVEPNVLPEEVDLPPAPGKWYNPGRAVNVNDNPGDGYQR
eukprot:SM000032S12106  [mRNA]  locus=s32:587028:587574:- [translate_table: standard]